MLGLLAMGEISDFSGIHDWITTGATYLPNSEHAHIYAELTDIYLRVYHQLKDEFDAISAFQNKYQ